MIAQRQADAPVNSLDLLFKPELAARFADCGISVIDSPDEVLAVVLNYLGRDPRSGAETALAATGLLSAIKPYIRKFQSQPVTDLAATSACPWATAAMSPSRSARRQRRASRWTSSTASPRGRCGWTPWPSPWMRGTRNTPMPSSTS